MQFEMDFEAGLTRRYPSLMEVVNACARNCGKPLKSLAADMDLSPSDLSRKLACNPDDTRHLQVRELVPLIESCGEAGHDIVYWLVERFLEDSEKRRERAIGLIADMAPVLMAALREVAQEDVKK